jgi:hypothetical protein
VLSIDSVVSMNDNVLFFGNAAQRDYFQDCIAKGGNMPD